jgi:acyl-CoA thioesterase FadM
VYTKSIPIRISDLDRHGCVSPTVYLTYLDELLGDWLKGSIGDNWVTLHVELDLRGELRREHREALARVRLDRVGRSSVTAHADILRTDGESAAEAVYVVAAWDPANRRTRPVTDAERAILAA